MIVLTEIMALHDVALRVSNLEDGDTYPSIAAFVFAGVSNRQLKQAAFQLRTETHQF